MAKRRKDAPPTNFLVGLATGHKVSIENPANTANAPVLKANPTTAATIFIAPNHYVKVVLQGNKRDPVILVGAAPHGTFFQRTVTLRPGQTIVLQASTLRTKVKHKFK